MLAISFTAMSNYFVFSPLLSILIQTPLASTKATLHTAGTTELCLSSPLAFKQHVSLAASPPLRTFYSDTHRA